MTAVLRSTNFLSFKISADKTVHAYFKNVEARYWQLKHYLSFRLKSDEIILPWNTVYDDWRLSLVYIFKDYSKIVPSSLSAFCKDLYNICDTFEGNVVRETCENLYNEFYELNLDVQINERIRQIDSTVFSEHKISEVLRMSSNKKRSVECNEAESSNGKRTRHVAPESEIDHEECEYENKLNLSNEESSLCNSQEESVEYDVEEIRNLLNESETCSQEMNKILSSFRTYQHETRNILSENGIMDLSPTSEFVLLYTEEVDYDKLIKENFESIDKMFPEKAHEFLTDFFSENLNEDQWEEKLENLMENKGSPEEFFQQSGENPRQDKFITKLKIFMLETLPTFFDAYKLMSENPLKNREMAEEEYMYTFVHPILKKALIRFSGIRYAIKASAYRKTIMNQDGKADRADGIAYTSNQQNSYEISVVEGSRSYVTERNKETNDFIQNARAAKDMINFAVTQEVLHKRALPSYFRTFMVQVFEFNLRFYFMDYLVQYCIFEIETCEIPTDWKETLQFTSFYRAIVTWALLVGEADKKFQQSRNKRSSRLSNCHNIRKVLKLSHNKAREGKKKDMTKTKLI
ncbi:9833_t:CDS:2 [Funneliformis geosporum]|uniref:13106_t:CDS:1 n=1 Tax=Funneliformis geosporum TaxID=1117311 RepID=A0A9W4SZ57_9GLOM|nr:13106_t:CDS:2 [Funneliformis geosporum]CAI2192793.1 9833_t:CDS:2 [Funneliformis geosporum]